ncbi:oxygen-dependent protoporphyrinogen oxidase [Melghirimyces profundicolus]|uniref:Coproporphyrinogen III oxidase n=1 Tax=Melghirimyces profundicolus TaxID=1242148 RepID=A0A2T6BV70_9BACL|nr:protoporphyrinogen oxidase [Melghirimyces profundicolus]PTX59978.1 oxygen-dependent protoporphyrinogen oxidase [Melghirimyces profundicolus]
MKRWRVAVVGGGITGLSAAFYLQKEAKERSIPLDLVLVESEKRLGGKIRTEHRGGFIMEQGPDSFLARKPSAKQLAVDLGLEKELVHNRAGQAYILHQGELLPIPEGAVMGIPTRITPFALSKLFSSAGKFRAIRDLFLPRRQNPDDLSVGTFFRRRLGDEVVDHLIEPLLSGIYAGDIDRLSLLATFPQFARLEEEHRSLILGLKRTRAPRKKEAPSKGQFLTLKKGLSSLVEAVEKQLPEEAVIKGNPLTRLIKEGSRYLLVLESNRVIQADGVILALPFDRMKALLPAAPLPEHPDPVPATSVATVILGFDAKALPAAPDGTGFVVPRREDTTLTACTWTHKKWPHTVPPGKAMIRCYVGRFGDDAIVEEPDPTILSRVRSDLKRIQGLDASPEFSRITRWRRAMPQYTVGHVRWREQLLDTCREQLPGLFPAGSSYGGIGLPDCIDQGKQAVSDVLDYLGLDNRR